MEIREKHYVTCLGKDCRRRHSRQYVGKWIVGFAVQLEIYFRGKWYPVIRYDTSHGFAHRDFIHWDGQVEKTPIICRDFNEALTFSENDLKANWQLYREQFLKEVKQND